MIAGFCYGTWNKLSTLESSPYSSKESIIPTFFAWPSTVGTQKYSLEVRIRDISTLANSLTGIFRYRTAKITPNFPSLI